MKRRSTTTEFDRLENALDDAWAAKVKARDGWQCRCGCGSVARAYMEAAHIVPRRFKSTRWLLGNGITLNRVCHQRFTDHPADFESFCRCLMGNDHYDELKRLGQQVFVPSVDAYAEAMRKLDGQAA